MSRRIQILDTTLRDGEQSPGIALQPHEKAEIAEQLERLGVDVVEAGFPGASPGDFEGVHTVAAAVRTPVVAAFARTHRGDIEAAGHALPAPGALASICRTYNLLIKSQLLCQLSYAPAREFLQPARLSPRQKSV